MPTQAELDAAGAAAGGILGVTAAVGWRPIVNSAAVVHFHPGSLKPALSPGIWLWAAPQPIGIVPPSVYHLDRRWALVTFHDAFKPVSGQSEPGDLTGSTKGGQDLYRYALGQITAARGLSNRQLRLGIEAVNKREAGSVLGVSDRVGIQRGVFALESQRRLSPTTHQVQPVYLPGGGVGLQLVYAPLPGETLPFMAGGFEGPPGVNPIGGRPPGPFSAPLTPSSAVGAVGTGVSYAGSRRNITEPTGLGSALGASVVSTTAATRAKHGRHTLAADPSTPPPRRRPGRTGLTSAVVALPGSAAGVVEQLGDTPAATAGVRRHRGVKRLKLDPTALHHVAQVTKVLS